MVDKTSAEYLKGYDDGFADCGNNPEIAPELKEVQTLLFSGFYEKAIQKLNKYINDIENGE